MAATGSLRSTGTTGVLVLSGSGREGVRALGTVSCIEVLTAEAPDLRGVCPDRPTSFCVSRVGTMLGVGSGGKF